MEKAPQIRTIGNASAEQKETAVRNLAKRLFNHFESLSTEEQEQLEKFEYPKSPKELACIDFANKETNSLMREAGVEPYDIPAENFHIVPSELYKKAAGEGGSATTYTTKQGILFDAEQFRGNAVLFGGVALHEALHLKAHLTIEVNEDSNDVDVTHYRQGVSIKALQKHGYTGEFHEHFRGLHEAIVAIHEKKSLSKLLELPELAKEKEWFLSDVAQTLKKEISQRKGVPEEDIIWVGENGKDDWEPVSYSKQRKVLEYVCSEIQKQFSDRYHNADKVFSEFLKSNFTGQLLHVARLVEKTFGEGSFRLLGNMDTDKSSGVLHLESLKKARMRQLRLKE